MAAIEACFGAWWPLAVAANLMGGIVLLAIADALGVLRRAVRGHAIGAAAKRSAGRRVGRTVATDRSSR